jgi:hypothetical protein
LNRFPGKNGSHWIVIPFTFTENNSVIRVSLRILLNEASESERMALDIHQKSPGRRWLFVLIPGTVPRMELGLWPAPEKSPEKELQAFFGADWQIRLRNDVDFSPLQAESRDEVLPSVNEEV